MTISLEQACDAAGAYAVVLAPGSRLLLVRTNGRLYLPGGRLEAGETPEQALRREIEEECGCPAAILRRLGEARQPIFGGRTRLRAYYFEALLEGRPGGGEHEPLWLPAAEAARRVHRRGDAWAIAALLAAAAPAVSCAA